MNIKELTKQKESEILGFKASPGELKEIIQNVSALVNTRDDKIIVGISKSGRLFEAEIGKDTIERLRNQISQNIDPKIHPWTRVERISKKNIIIIGLNPVRSRTRTNASATSNGVKEPPDHLVLVFGRPFKRIGRSTVKMSKDEYERLILEKHKDKLQFDKEICKEADLKDIDWGFVKEEFIPLYEKVSERKVVGTSQSLLESLGCIKDRGYLWYEI